MAVRNKMNNPTEPDFITIMPHGEFVLSARRMADGTWEGRMVTCGNQKHFETGLKDLAAAIEWMDEQSDGVEYGLYVPYYRNDGDEDG